MGNCLPFLQAQISEDLTRLNSITRGRSSSDSDGLSHNHHQSSGGHRRRDHSTHRQNSEGSSGRSEGSGRQHRNTRNVYSVIISYLLFEHNFYLQSSYVNELYMSSIIPNEDTQGGDKITDQKRQARVRGLLEQIPIDIYVAGGKGGVECAICMVEFEENDKIRFLPCLHNYHVECIDGTNFTILNSKK
jgi:hypothetical protein